jgi:hypothetical protein
MRVCATIVFVLCASCVPEEGPLMAPGQDCIECHDGGEAKGWTAAGTWARGAHVTVTDANGKTVTMQGNKVGNFYTAEPLTLPLTVDVDGVDMPGDALQSAAWSSAHMNYGGCNLCHANRETIDLELMAPGRNCLGCHDGVMAVKFTVAGTWKPGVVVRVVDRNSKSWTLPAANQAGNFYTEEPLEFPLTQAWVDNEEMSREKMPKVTHGSCNLCHRPGGEADD